MSKINQVNCLREVFCKIFNCNYVESLARFSAQRCFCKVNVAEFRGGEFQDQIVVSKLGKEKLSPSPKILQKPVCPYLNKVSLEKFLLFYHFYRRPSILIFCIFLDLIFSFWTSFRKIIFISHIFSRLFIL